MRIQLLCLAGAAAVASGFAATAADARPHYRRAVVCTRWHDHRCVESHGVREGHYRVGYVFGPAYGYTAYSSLPRPYVVRYRLNRDDRYVYNNGYIYVVDPTTYAITRILRAVR
jgi:hypothetical protein